MRQKKKELTDSSHEATQPRSHAGEAAGNRQPATNVGNASADHQYRNREGINRASVLPAESTASAPAWSTPQENPAGPSRDDWDRAARHPLVQKIKDAFDGTLFDVQPAAMAKAEIVSAPHEGSVLSDAPGEHDPTVVDDES